MSAKPILIIDDDMGLQAALSATLEGAGYAVDTAPTLKEGLAKLAVSQFDMTIAELFTRGVKTEDIGTKDFLEKFVKDSRLCKHLLVLTGFADF